MPEPSRQLAAIMFTDIVGYTALMGQDSKKALELIRVSKEIQKPLVEKHNGKWLKEMGDGALCSFGSALDAVNCAVEIQKSARAELEAKLRIGIHSGDITIENDDVYGDGVNVASRLESIADPGGIYISDAIEKAIRGQSVIQTEFLGERRLKNVSYGVRIYALCGDGLPERPKSGKTHSKSFLQELQARGVHRAASLYIIVSLLMYELFARIQVWLVLPDWSNNVLILFLFFGFPIALFLAWNYERSPDGFVLIGSIESLNNPYSDVHKKPMTGNVVFIASVVLVLFVYFFTMSSTPSDPALDTEHLQPNPSQKSIAVLPFTNLSGDPEQEYFSDGMMEEILNHLFKIGDLKVTSRTSVMRYKNTTKSIGQIAQELNVVNILEGSVRKEEDQVRITVQLIDSKTDQQLWGESYDRELTGVFAIQSEVAQLVASTLNAQIQPKIRDHMDRPPTSHIEAYELFLKAQNLGSWVDEPLTQQIEIYRRAIQLDSNFARAYANLGNAIIFQAGFAHDKNPLDVGLEGKAYLQKAIYLDPLDGFAHNNLGNYYLWFEKEFSKAEIEFVTARSLLPSLASNHYMDFLLASGRFREAIQEAEKMADAESSPLRWAFLALANSFGGNILEMENYIQKTFEKPVENTQVFIESARAFIIQGKYDRALEILTSAKGGEQMPRFIALKAIAYNKLGDSVKHEFELTSLLRRSQESAGGSPAFFLAMTYSSKGQVDEAFKWLQKSFKNNEIELYWLNVEPEFEPLYDDPRWQEMFDKVGFPD